MILGIDQSLTSTGFAYRKADGSPAAEILIQKEGKGMKRLDRIHNKAVDLAVKHKVTLAVFEGYAYGFKATASRAHSLGEIGGILKYGLWSNGIDIMVVPPNSLKMFMLGKYKTVVTNAAGKKVKVKVKDQVMAAAEKHSGLRFHTNDQADAYVLLLMGEARCQTPSHAQKMDSVQALALQGCEFIQGKR